MATTPSTRPQLAKLGLIPGARWRLDGEDPAWSFEVEPDQADRVGDTEPADVVIAFVRSAAEVELTLERLEHGIYPAGALWIAWPRKAAGHDSDLGDTVIREAALARSLVDTKVAAIDTHWSGLRLVWRVSARG